MLIDLDKGLFSLDAPDKYPFTFEEVFTGLSRMPRFNNRSRNDKRPLDVLTHSILVTYIATYVAKDKSVLDRDDVKSYDVLTLAAITHDDHEYVIGDISTPVGKKLRGIKSLKRDISTSMKRTMMSNASGELTHAVISAHTNTGCTIHNLVRFADNVALAYEAERLGFDVRNYPPVFADKKLETFVRGNLEVAQATSISWHPSAVHGVVEMCNNIINKYRKD